MKFVNPDGARYVCTSRLVTGREGACDCDVCCQPGTHVQVADESLVETVVQQDQVRQFEESGLDVEPSRLVDRQTGAANER